MRQIRRRNSLDDLSASNQIIKKSTTSRKSVPDKVIEALTSPDILAKIVPVISEKIGESIAESINKAIDAKLQTFMDTHIKPLQNTIDTQQQKIDKLNTATKKKRQN